MRQRMILRLLLSLAVALALGLPGAAPAQDDDDGDDDEPGLYEDTGFYLTAMGVAAPWTQAGELENRAEDHNSNPTAMPPITANADMDSVVWGMNARAGYRLHPRFAVEAQFEWLTESNREVDLSDGTKGTDHISLFTVTANGKYYLRTERVQPYVVGGAGWGRSRIDQAFGSTRSNNGVSARFGAGVDLYGSPDVALSLETAYVWNSGGVNDLSYVSLGAGLTLRFYGGY